MPTPRPVIIGADPQQERDLIAVHNEMVFLLERQLASIENNAQRGTGQYERTFGEFRPGRHRHVTDTLGLILGLLQNAPMVYDLTDPAHRCGQTEGRSRYGYVLPGNKNTVFLCASAFFDRPLSGDVSQPGTLFFLVALTIYGIDATDYTRQGVFNLAALDPDVAIVTASSYAVNFELSPYNWAGNRVIANDDGSGPKTDSNPGLAVYSPENELYAIYKGESSGSLYTVRYDGRIWYANQQITTPGSDPQSEYSPNLVGYNNQLYTVYKGKRSTDLYFAVYDGRLWSGNLTIRKFYGRDLQSDFNPGMATFDGKIYIVYRRPGKPELYYSFFERGTWAEEQVIRVNDIAVASDRNPRLVAYDDKLYMIFKGQGSNPNGVYYAYFDGTAWHGNETFVVSGSDVPVTTIDSPGVAVLDGILHIVLRRSDAADFDLYEITFNRIADVDRNFWLGNFPVRDNSQIDPKSDQSPSLAGYKGKLVMVYKGFDTTRLYSSSQ